jgi:hypothetical protein
VNGGDSSKKVGKLSDDKTLKAWQLGLSFSVN